MINCLSLKVFIWWLLVFPTLSKLDVIKSRKGDLTGISFVPSHFCTQQVGDVRLTALQALRGLYENEAFVPQLELFTDRFKVAKHLFRFL